LKENNYEIRRGITERTAASFDSEVFPSEDIGRLYREFVSLVHKACGPKDYILYKTKNTLLRIKNKAIRFLKSI
jgi:hypothetical protein